MGFEGPTPGLRGSQAEKPQPALESPVNGLAWLQG